MKNASTDLYILVAQYNETMKDIRLVYLLMKINFSQKECHDYTVCGDLAKSSA